jgi:hypothetical protein
MEQTEIEKRVKERFATLPKKLQEAIQGADVSEKLRAIALKHKLHIDQGQELENETLLVMLGFDVVEHFKENIKKALRIQEELAEAITTDVHNDIFLSIRELLKESTTPQEKTETKPQNIPQITPEGTYTIDPYREPPV